MSDGMGDTSWGGPDGTVPGQSDELVPGQIVPKEMFSALLDKYLELKNLIFKYFGYEEDWRVIPIEDNRQYFWAIEGGESSGGQVKFAETMEKFNSDGNYYINEIYTQRHLPKWVYRSADFTMICVDTNTDGNKFLSIFDSTKEVKA